MSRAVPGGGKHDEAVGDLGFPVDTVVDRPVEVDELGEGVVGSACRFELGRLHDDAPPGECGVRAAVVEVQVAVDDDVDRVDAASRVPTGEIEGAPLRLVARLDVGVCSADPRVEDDGELGVGDELAVDGLDPGLAGAGLDPGLAGAGLGSRSHEEAEVEPVDVVDAGQPGHGNRSSRRSASMTGAKASMSRTT